MGRAGRAAHVPAAAILGWIDVTNIKCDRTCSGVAEFKRNINNETKEKLQAFTSAMNDTLQRQRIARAQQENGDNDEQGDAAQRRQQGTREQQWAPNGERAQNWKREDAIRVLLFHSAYTEAQSELGGRSTQESKWAAMYWDKKRVIRVEHMLSHNGANVMSENEINSRFLEVCEHMKSMQIKQSNRC